MEAGTSGSSAVKVREETDQGSTNDDGPDPKPIGDPPRQNGSSLPKGEIFDLLKNSRRRQIIQYLREHDGYAELNDVAEHIAAEENDTTVRQLSSDQRKRVYIGLYQCHLPKMDKLGVVEYDKNRGTIELQDSVTDLLRYMDTDESADRKTPDRDRAIPAVAGFVVALVSLGTLGIGALSSIPAAGWTLLSIVGIVVIVGLHYGL